MGEVQVGSTGMLDRLCGIGLQARICAATPDDVLGDSGRPPASIVEADYRDQRAKSQKMHRRLQYSYADDSANLLSTALYRVCHLPHNADKGSSLAA